MKFKRMECDRKYFDGEECDFCEEREFDTDFFYPWFKVNNNLDICNSCVADLLQQIEDILKLKEVKLLIKKFKENEYEYFYGHITLNIFGMQHFEVFREFKIQLKKNIGWWITNNKMFEVVYYKATKMLIMEGMKDYCALVKTDYKTYVQESGIEDDINEELIEVK